MDKPKRTRRKKIVLTFNLEDFKDIKMMDDFFDIMGITSYIKDKSITDFKQLEMNKKDGEAILEYWLANWNKIKILRGYKEQYAQSRISMTWMNYAPVYNPKCKRGELFLYPHRKKEITK